MCHTSIFKIDYAKEISALAGNRTPGPRMLEYFVFTIEMGSADFTTKPLVLVVLM